MIYEIEDLKTDITNQNLHINIFNLLHKKK